MAFYLTNTVAAGMLNSTGLAESLGASPRIRIYSGTVPTNADAALSGNTLLAELVCAATPFSGYTDTGTAARATFGAIASDSSADNTGTATFFRLVDSAGTTTKGQGSVGTSSADLVLNTVSLTAGSTVSITSATIDLPEGP
ncbi:hypothetical protein EB72_24860 [Mycobacterium sp. SWH-M1]|nr:hypothetical protein EB72_24860 [Mycobacterium sp. SWH-M1]